MVDDAAQSPVLRRSHGTVAVLTLNRPEARNAVDDDMREAVIDALAEVVADRDVRAVVLTGAGSAFCAGGDVASMHERLSAPIAQVAETGWRRQRQTHRMVVDLHKLEKVTVAAVNGPAIGVGMDHDEVLDVRHAADPDVVALGAHDGVVPDRGALATGPKVALQEGPNSSPCLTIVTIPEGACSS